MSSLVQAAPEYGILISYSTRTITTMVEVKRQNFNVTPDQDAELLALQSEFDAPSVKDAIFKAVRLARFLRREVQSGKRIGLRDRKGNVIEVVLPELEGSGTSSWTYLVSRSHSWKRQLFVKGRRLTAFQVWLDMRSNGMTESDAAENWDLPEEAISEIVEYCENNAALLKMEADEERLFLTSQGLKLSS